MSKSIDLLSKNLASGMSRRKALWQFVTGLGAVGALGALTGKKAAASQKVSLECQIFCNTQSKWFLAACAAANNTNILEQAICNGINDIFLTACLAASARCGASTSLCAEFVLVNRDNISVGSFNAFVAGDHNFICVYPPGLEI